MALLECWKGRHVSTGGCVSGFLLHTAAFMGNCRHHWLSRCLWDCLMTISQKCTWKFTRNLLTRQTASSSRGGETTVLQGWGDLGEPPREQLHWGQGRDCSQAAALRASWDVCLPGEQLACKCLAEIHNSLLPCCLEKRHRAGYPSQSVALVGGTEAYLWNRWWGQGQADTETIPRAQLLWHIRLLLSLHPIITPCPAHCRGFGTTRSSRSHPSQIILWLYTAFAMSSGSGCHFQGGIGDALLKLFCFDSIFSRGCWSRRDTCLY